jgi:hemerythrin-like domain-containing protein
MQAIERLERDHTILRSKLDVLEAALGMGPRTWFVLREVCFTLARQLRDHIRREEALVASCRQALSASGLDRMAVEHHDEPKLLGAINRLFLKEQGQTLERIGPRLQELIRGLRQHMDEEEATMFPAIERLLSGRDEAGAPAAASPHLDESMTINRVVRDYPTTRPILERLFVNIPCEGTCCLDEVAWRHGLEAKELMALLEDAVEPAGASEGRQRG